MMSNKILINTEKLPNTVSVGFFEVTSPWIHYDRIMDVDSLLFVISGTIFLCEDNIDYTINANEIFCLKGGVRHYGKQTIMPGSKWFWISFSSIDSDILSDCLLSALPKQQNITEFSKMTNLFYEIVELFNASSPYRLIMINNYLHQIFLKMMILEHKCSDFPHSLTQEIIRLLEQNIEHDFHVNEIATYLNHNYNYLCRVFKSDTHTTILQYYTELKIQHAIKLMLTSNRSITEISSLLHFPNQYYFSKVFKKTTGYSPREYKHLLYYKEV